MSDRPSIKTTAVAYEQQQQFKLQTSGSSHISPISHCVRNSNNKNNNNNSSSSNSSSSSSSSSGSSGSSSSSSSTSTSTSSNSSSNSNKNTNTSTNNNNNKPSHLKKLYKSNNNNNNNNDKKPQKREEQIHSVILKTPIARRPSVSAPTTPLQRRYTSSKTKRNERRKEIYEVLNAELEPVSDLDNSSSSSSDTSLAKKKANRISMFINGSKRQDTSTIRKRHHSNNAIDGRVYAGPMFSNSPAPDTLPIPTFSSSPIVPIVQEPVNILSASASPSFSLREFDVDLSEIQSKLRALLKM
ncbi:unnamed protein product [Rhizopus microsporus]